MFLTTLRAIFRSTSITVHAGLLLVLLMLETVSLLLVGYASSVLNLYEDVIYGGGGRGLAVSSYALSPFTSVIGEKDIIDLVGNTTGVNVKYVVFAIVYVDNMVIVVHGMDDESLNKLVGGVTLGDRCMFISRELSRELGIGEGDSLPLYSAFTHETIITRVCRIIEPGYPYTYELVTSIDLARILRGIGRGYYSIALLYFDNENSAKEIAGKLTGEEYKSIIERALIYLSRTNKTINPEIIMDVSGGYWARLGFYKDSLLLLAYVTTALVLLCTPLISDALYRHLYTTLNQLHGVGVSRRVITMALALLLLFYTALSMLLSLFLTIWISNILELRVFSYVVEAHVDVLAGIYVFMILYALLLTGVMGEVVRSWGKQSPY
ncbi:hypothetical protein [Desulfurococcus amylolyticus]|uniref:MacB-like periplasmic core domain-containing protein n=1 Tax=Desulfurococcus amylolyticus DSM 16532 TaxID=768672 RepID=I3XT45_DESAM|nr:hypothetical protein [Desulfurococcus amylolyticus]AFL67119.1 hypothetical protein Desfe_1250 [Desulfurococcus amylolyticus DSM 16532]